MAIRTSSGNVAGYSGATTPGLVNDKKTQETGGIHTKPTGSPHVIPGTEPDDTVVEDMGADTRAIGNAASKLNDPPAGDLGPSTPWSLPAWEDVRKGLCVVAGVVVGGASAAAAITADKHADIAAQVLLPIVVAGACGFSGWLVSQVCPKSTDD